MSSARKASYRSSCDGTNINMEVFMLKIRFFEVNDIAKCDLVGILKELHEKIFLTPVGVTLNEAISPYIHSPAAVRKISIYYDENKPVGFMCMQRYEVDINGKKINVFRSQAGLLEKYRENNTTKLIYLKFIFSELLRHPRKSLFFAICIHPSSYCAILKGPYGRINAWPTEENVSSNIEMRCLCKKLCNSFNLEVEERDGVFIYNDGLGPTRNEKTSRSSISDDAAFFMKINPKYVNGDGVATIVNFSIIDVSRHFLYQIFSKVKRKLNI